MADIPLNLPPLSERASYTASQNGHEPEAGTAEEAEQPPANKSKSTATRLVDMAERQGAELFHSPDGSEYITFAAGDHSETWPLRARAVRLWLGSLYYKQTLCTAGSQALQDAVDTLGGKARYEGVERAVYVRLARHEGGAIYLDLANTGWQAVEITAAGWRVVDSPHVRFRRPKGMLALPTPERGGHVEELRPFVNAASAGDLALLLAFMVGALKPEGPYPVLVLTGEQGSAKSTLGRMVRALVDPNAVPLRAEPRNSHELMISAGNSWLIAFDNLSRLSGWLSDDLCRLSTGGGFSARELYADAEETLFDAVRPALLTSIEDVVTRSDLLDRALILNLEAIPPRARRSEAALWAAFNEASPRILAGLLDAVATAMRRQPAINLPSLPRMADFAITATAAEPALGLADGAIMAAYLGNRQEAHNLALDASPVPDVLEALLRECEPPEWAGTATALLEALKLQAGLEDNKRLPEGWPARADKLSSLLKRLAPNLRERGIDVRSARAGRRRTITIRLEAQSSVTGVTGVTPASEKARNGDATSAPGDATSGTSDAGDATSGTSDASDATLQAYSCVIAPGGLCTKCAPPCEYAQRHPDWAGTVR